MQKKYRPNVAMIILNEEGKILTCERQDVPSAWQLPQGGIDAGESPETALWREMEEELGTKQAKILGKLEHSIKYDWPEHLYSRGYRGQEQYYFLLRLEQNAQIKLDTEHQEFSAFKWLLKKDFLSLVEGFKREAYKKALELFDDKHPDLIK